MGRDRWLGTLRRRTVWLLVVGLVTAGCESAGDVDDGGSAAEGETAATGPTADPSAEPVEPAGGEVDACTLLTLDDAEAILGDTAARVVDPVADGLVGQDVPTYRSLCYYRPVPPDASRVVGIVVLPDDLPRQAFETVIRGGVPVGERGYEAWDVGGGIVVRKGGITLAIVAVTEEGGGLDGDAGLEVASRAAARLSDPAEDR